MYPNLLGISYLHTYGFLTGIAIVAAMYLATVLGRQSGIKEKHLNRLFLFGVVLGILGGRLLHVIQNYEYFVKNPSEILMINQGGLVIYGAIIMAIVTWLTYIKINKLPTMKTLDVLLTSLPLGLGIGRIGCFAAGCCYGYPILRADVPWYAIKFPDRPDSIAPTDHYVFPSQLVDAAYNFLILAILLVFRKKFQKYNGQASWLFLILYGTFRSISEIYRGDTDRGFVIQGYISTSQAISIPIVLFALYMLIFYKGDKFVIQKCNLKK